MTDLSLYSSPSLEVFYYPLLDNGGRILQVLYHVSTVTACLISQ